MAQSSPGTGDIPAFTPELLDETKIRIRTVLGPTWGRIEREDDRSRPIHARHLLAVIDDYASLFAADYRRGRFPGHLPDFMALYLIGQVLERMRDEPTFPEIRAGLADRGSFRHDMLRLGLADHLRIHTTYPVVLPQGGRPGERVVDLVVGGAATLDVETKSSIEFDGPRKHVTYTDAWNGIRKAWRSAYGGDNPQLREDRASAILVGGVAVQTGSMREIARAASSWLERKGGHHPNCWGILGMTFLSFSRFPPGRRIGDGRPVTVTAIATPFLVGTPNPHYRGLVQLVLTPPTW